MRAAWTASVLLAMPAIVHGQAVVRSGAPDKVAVTVYRSDEGPLNLRWLNGFAMVSETRHVVLPAGDVDLRFEGVTGGIVPQSAIVTGLGDSLVEKNRDAMLLSPGTLLSAVLGERVHLRRTSRANGQVVEQDAILRSGPNGVVVQTEAGFEALRCSGLNETIRASEVPASLSAKPTLSSRLRLSAPVEATVTLTYLSTNFDWRAHYVAMLAPNGKSMALFAWLTMANGDSTSLQSADAMAVAGKLNRQRVYVPPPEVRPIMLSCWPSDTTSDIEEESQEIVVTARRMPVAMAAPPPPPAPPVMDAAIATTAIQAQREQLGDLKLYRIPEAVTVAANSQKQVALLRQPAALLSSIARVTLAPNGERTPPAVAARLLLFNNDKADGLGLPLPAGRLSLFTVRDGKPFLLGEGAMSDRAEGEKVELAIDQPSGVMVSQRQLGPSRGRNTAEVVVRNTQPSPARVEVVFVPGLELEARGARLVSRDGAKVWVIDVAPGGQRTLRYRWTPKS